jgi:hypothetical protein
MTERTLRYVFVLKELKFFLRVHWSSLERLVVPVFILSFISYILLFKSVLSIFVMKNSTILT